MEFGIFLPARVDIHPIVQRAEAAGFTHAWLYDSQMLFADVYACLALCAEHTRTIKLGPGVTNPASRIAPLTASCMATINQMAPGRAVLGIGTGNTTRRAMGMPPARVDAMREYISVCQALMRGEKAVYREGGRERVVQMISRDNGFMNFHDPIPIVVSAFGPRTLELTGELADGAMIGGRPVEVDVARVRAQMQKGAEKAGRKAEELGIVLYTSVYVLSPGEEVGSARMVRGLAPLVLPAIVRYALQAKSEADIPPAFRASVAGYRAMVGELRGERRYIDAYEGYLWEVREPFLKLITEEMLRATTLIGTADEVLRQVKTWEALGITQVGLRAAGYEFAGEYVEQIGREVIARY